MNIIGIICEYNPFHNGHLYHLNKIKELFPDSLIILVMSGNFTQRGIPSILDKWTKTEIALQHDIDIVVELPFPFATQSADIFAKGAISILNHLKVESLVFGSESEDITTIKELAHYSFTDEYQTKVRELLNQGINYPSALNKAFTGFKNVTVETPNDLLALSYIKEIISGKSTIKPINIKRTNDFHNQNINTNIASASAIRNAITKKEDISNTVPNNVKQKLIEQTFINEDYFPILKYKIQSTKDLSIYQTVDEGIDNRIKKYIDESKSLEELITKIKTKRYTYNKISRMLTHILCDFTKETASKMKEIEYIRVLGFTKNGKEYLNTIKKDIQVPIITTFSKGNSDMLKYEKVITSVYASILPEDKKKELIEKEYKQIPIIK